MPPVYSGGGGVLEQDGTVVQLAREFFSEKQNAVNDDAPYTRTLEFENKDNLVSQQCW